MEIFYFIEKKLNRYIEHFINNGGNINIKDNDGNTPLMFALQNKNDKYIIQLLIDNGANDDLETLKEKIKESDYKTEMLLFIDEYYIIV
jgi:ankyrin repeat protein